MCEFLKYYPKKQIMVYNYGYFIKLKVISVN